jgi:hypothetical protein
VIFHRDPKEARLRGYDCMQLGLMLQIFGAILLAAVDANSTAGDFAIFFANILIILGAALLVGGCGTFAVYHGRDRWWGMLGLFSVVGVLVILIIPRSPRAIESGGGFEVRYNVPYHRDVWRMDVKVTLDSSVEAGIAEPIMLQVPRGASIAAAMKTLAGPLPILQELIPVLRFQINGERAKQSDELSNGDELLVLKQNAMTESASHPTVISHPDIISHPTASLPESNLPAQM